MINASVTTPPHRPPTDRGKEIGWWGGFLLRSALATVFGRSIASVVNFASDRGASYWLTMPLALTIGPLIAVCLVCGSRIGAKVSQWLWQQWLCRGKR